MSASLPLEILQKYKGGSLLFFETGTSEGDSTQTALDAGFKYVLTVELDRATHTRAYERFRGNDGVTVAFGSSVEILEKTLPDVSMPTLFFLDAHLPCDAENTPMGIELELISKLCPVECTIIIDDMRLLGHQKWALTLENLVKLVNTLFPKHNIAFEDNAHQAGDLMVIYKEDNL